MILPRFTSIEHPSTSRCCTIRAHTDVVRTDGSLNHSESQGHEPVTGGSPAAQPSRAELRLHVHGMDCADEASLVRHVLADAPASFGVERAGWVGFSTRLATPDLLASGLTPISGLGFEAIVARVVTRAREACVLRYFGASCRHPGFVPSLARTLTDLRLAPPLPAWALTHNLKTLKTAPAGSSSAGFSAERIAQGLCIPLEELLEANRRGLLHVSVSHVTCNRGSVLGVRFTF